jgi:ribosomal protein S18 acetylase RimI-like enzyme
MIIRSAQFPEDLDQLLEIWREYIASANADLGYQGNEQEFAVLPGKYAQPKGHILLAFHNGELVGVIAMRPFNAEICEMKRLYVRPSARGLSLGEKLVEQLIERARSSGYQEMRLDVLAEFDRAQALYAKFGFVEAEPITHNPVPGTRFLGLKLRDTKISNRRTETAL